MKKEKGIWPVFNRRLLRNNNAEFNNTHTHKPHTGGELIFIFTILSLSVKKR
jgi:hypothetical protein